jgi:hypothetical protein
MSNFQKRRYFMKKGSKFRRSEHNGLKNFLKSEKFVTLIFIYILAKNI